MTKPLHLAWFTPFKTPDWRDTYAGRDGLDWLNGKFYVDMVRQLEEACFDYVMFEDSLMVSDIYRGTSEHELKYALHAPKGDPVPLLSFLAGQTSRIGLIATISTSFAEPYNVARAMATMDHLSQGRIGWNVVTSSEDMAAKNYGKDLAEHDHRYEQADEFVDVVFQLWDSWDKDAVVADHENNIYADFRKVHTIDYKGAYFSSRGPLNLPPGPQGRPVICQAGGSPRGRKFAAAHADTILSIPKGTEAMREYRDDIRRLAVESGRQPDDVKVMYIIEPVLGRTEDEARAKAEERWPTDDRAVDQKLGHMSITTEIDFSQFDLDAPLPDEAQTNGHMSTFESFKKRSAGKTLREAIAGDRIEAIPLIGTPATVAERMGEVIEEVGGDGFLIRGLPLTRQYINEITGGLVPELQKRGLLRTSYAEPMLRDRLQAF